VIVPIDGTRLQRIGGLLDQMLTHLDEATGAATIPAGDYYAGRPAAKIHSVVSDARSAIEELGPLAEQHAPLRQAVDAVEALQARAQGVSGYQGSYYTRAAAELRSAPVIDDVRWWAATLPRLGSAADIDVLRVASSPRLAGDALRQVLRTQDRELLTHLDRVSGGLHHAFADANAANIAIGDLKAGRGGAAEFEALAGQVPDVTPEAIQARMAQLVELEQGSASIAARAATELRTILRLPERGGDLPRALGIGDRAATERAFDTARALLATPRDQANVRFVELLGATEEPELRELRGLVNAHPHLQSMFVEPAWAAQYLDTVAGADSIGLTQQAAAQLAVALEVQTPEAARAALAEAVDIAGDRASLWRAQLIAGLPESVRPPIAKTMPRDQDRVLEGITVDGFRPSESQQQQAFTDNWALYHVTDDASARELVEKALAENYSERHLKALVHVPDVVADTFPNPAKARALLDEIPRSKDLAGVRERLRMLLMPSSPEEVRAAVATLAATDPTVAGMSVVRRAAAMMQTEQAAGLPRPEGWAATQQWLTNAAQGNSWAHSTIEQAASRLASLHGSLRVSDADSARMALRELLTMDAPNPEVATRLALSGHDVEAALQNPSIARQLLDKLVAAPNYDERRRLLQALQAVERGSSASPAERQALLQAELAAPEPDTAALLALAFRGDELQGAWRDPAWAAGQFRRMIDGDASAVRSAASALQLAADATSPLDVERRLHVLLHGDSERRMLEHVIAARQLPEAIRPAIRDADYDGLRIAFEERIAHATTNAVRVLDDVRADLSARPEIREGVLAELRAGTATPGGLDAASRLALSAADLDTALAQTIAHIDPAIASRTPLPTVQRLTRVLDRLARQATPDGPAQEQVLANLREQAASNVARIDGRLRDGYISHPDYAELGRSAENTRLLLTLRRGAADGADTAAEALSW
jgi:hypothetical protein